MIRSSSFCAGSLFRLPLKVLYSKVLSDAGEPLSRGTSRVLMTRKVNNRSHLVRHQSF